MHQRPAAASGSKLLTAGSGRLGPQNSPRKARTSPISPAVRLPRTALVSGWDRVHMPSMQKTRFSRAAAMICAAEAASAANGFSSRTGLPAAIPARAYSSCVDGGVAI